MLGTCVKSYIYWLYFHERNTFSYDILDWAANWPTYLCAMESHYKLSLTGGLILSFGLVCLLLICFRLDFNVHFIFIVLWMVWFHVVLHLPVDDAISGSYFVASGFLI